MKKHKKNRQRDIGPNPDPKKYVLVRTKEGNYYRQIRGSIKPALLNDACRKSAESTKICSPAARRVVMALKDGLRGLQTGRLTVHINSALKKAYHQKGALDFSFLEGFDFQEDHPLEALLKTSYTCIVNNRKIKVQLPIDNYSVKKHNQIVSGYYFDLILLWGDATIEEGLHVEQVTSALYAFGTKKESVCTLHLDLPESAEPWLILLKLSCLEGDEIAHHPRHYGMKVLKQGN